MAERRQAPRYLSDLKGRVSPLAGGAGSNVEIVTLSVKGACLKGTHMSKGEKCRLIIDWQGRQVRADAEVMWTKTEGRAGLKFVAMQEESELLLREICTSLLLQPLAKVPEEPDSIP